MTGPRVSLAGWRDTVLFLTGIGLIIYEAVLRTGPERYGLLVLYSGMVGLPALLRMDENRASKRDPDPEAPPGDQPV